MKLALSFVLYSVFILPSTAATALSGADTTSQQTISIKHVFDLTHTLTEDFPYNPVSGVYYPFDMSVQTTIKQDGVASNEWRNHEHIGTQIDAPSYLAFAGKSLDQMPVENFVAPLTVIDIRERAKRKPNTMVTIDDIKAWEERHGRLPRGAAVFMSSGKWSIECVANLDRVPPSGATVFLGASKVEGATGGPVRLIATF